MQMVKMMEEGRERCRGSENQLVNAHDMVRGNDSIESVL